MRVPVCKPARARVSLLTHACVVNVRMQFCTHVHITVCVLRVHCACTHVSTCIRRYVHIGTFLGRTERAPTGWRGRPCQRADCIDADRFLGATERAGTCWRPTPCVFTGWTMISTVLTLSQLAELSCIAVGCMSRPKRRLCCFAG